MKLEGQFLKLLGHNQGLTRLVETGDLQPLQNLNQLTTLNLEGCRNLIGQSVSGFVWAQISSSPIGRFLGTLDPLSGLSQLQELVLFNTNFTGQSDSEICAGTTKLSRDWWKQVIFNRSRI